MGTKIDMHERLEQSLLIEKFFFDQSEGKVTPLMVRSIYNAALNDAEEATKTFIEHNPQHSLALTALLSELENWALVSKT